MGLTLPNRYVELLKKTGAAPSVLLKVDGAAAAEGDDCAVVASAAPKSFSVKVFPSIMSPHVSCCYAATFFLLLCCHMFPVIMLPLVSCVLIRSQDTKKKKRVPKAGSLEDWETEAQSVSLGEFDASSAHFMM